MIHLSVLHEVYSRELKIIIEEKNSAEESTLQQYFTTNICLDTLKSLSQEVYNLLYRSTHSSGNNDRGIGQSLQQVGRQLYDSLFPLQVKEKLASTGSQDLYLTIDESLVGLPWEILYDGEEFFGLRFNIGRKVQTSHPVVDFSGRNNDPKIKMWILADPRNDLPDSYHEGDTLSQRLNQWDDTLELYLETTNIDAKRISRRIFEYDIIHYAGHAAYNQEEPNLSGWHLKDGYLTAQQILQMSGGRKSFPSLIFSNACQSGQTLAWPKAAPGESIHYQAFDLVNAFLRCGVRHYIGTFQDIADPTSLNLALNFYNFMMQSCSIGESLRRARLQLIDQYGRDNLIWANYMLYGNPTICYLNRLDEKKNQGDINLQGSKGEFNCRKELETGNHYPEDYKKEKVLAWRADAGEVGESLSRSKASPHDAVSPPKVKLKEESKSDPQNWRRKIFFGLWLGFFLFFILIMIRFFLYPPNSTTSVSNNGQEISWEKEKWQIVRQIQDKMSQRFSGQINHHQTSSGNEPFTICIISAIPQGRELPIDQKKTDLLIEELNLFWMSQPGFTLVERDRLDFVLEEMERATSNISETEVRFALNKILGAKGIVFVRIFNESKYFLLPFLNRESKVFVRYVNTETTAVEAYAKASFDDSKNFDELGRDLGQQILLTLGNRYKL